MSAPLLKNMSAFNLIKSGGISQFRQRIAISVRSCQFSDSKSNDNDFQAEDNVSNNSLNSKVAETNDIEIQNTEIQDTQEIKEPADLQAKVGSYAKAFEKIEEVRASIDKKPESKLANKSFATLLRQSKLIQLGEASGSVVVGEIFEVHDEDLYIDFGGKFPCVCPRPKSDSWKYTRGAKVTIQLKTLEMASRFIGSDKHVTLLEADAVLKGLHETET